MERIKVETRPGVQLGTTEVERRPGFHWSAALWASLLGGLAHLVFLTIFMPIVYGFSAWQPTRLMASVVMGGDVVPVTTFAIGPFLAGLAVLAVASVIYGYIGLGILRPFHPVTAYLGGAIFGLILYFINFYLWSAAFPWFSDFRNWVNVLGHVIFGLVLGGVYYAIKRRDFERHRRIVENPVTGY